MTISQRLTRAGFTILLLGTVAAVVPSNSSALATTVNCSGGPTTEYRFTDQVSGTPDDTATTIAAGGHIFLFTFVSNDGGQTFQPVSNIPVAAFGAPTQVVQLSSTFTTNVPPRVRADSIARGSGFVVATFTDTASVSEPVAFGITVN